MSEKIEITPDSDCKFCGGTGEVYDLVPMPFGTGSIQMPGLCACVEEQIPEDYYDEEIVLILEQEE